MTHWLHIIADLFDCNFNYFISKSTVGDTKKLLSNLIKECWLTELWHYYHEFDKDSYTAVIALAESHISIHTRPEDKYISLDIFVCNYSFDNRSNAIQIYDALKKIYKPWKIKETFLDR